MLFMLLLLCGAAYAQTNSATQSASATSTAEAKPKKQIFRANKEQIMQAQKLLKDGSMYGGEQTGKLDKATRDGLKKYQGANGLKATGTLNRATLEKMGVELTETQKAIPATPNSYAVSGDGSANSGSSSAKSSTDTSGSKPKKTIFRASKEQITEAQKILKADSHYKGEETGKLDTATRDALKKYQEANGIKPTGTLNRETLEKMGIALNDKQKADAGN